MLACMDRRPELLFDVSAPAQATVLVAPYNTLSVSLISISADGLRLRAAQEWSSNQLIVVELENHLLLAEVRDSNCDGSEFVIDAKRLHSLAKMDLPPDLARLENVHAVVHDFYLRSRGVGDTPDESGTGPASEEGYDLEPLLTFHSIPKATEPVLPTAARAAHPQSTSAAILEELKLRRLRSRTLQ
jgi:hypothetical protein